MSDPIRFNLVRDSGIVANGVLFDDGASVLRWRGETRSTVCYDSFQSVLDVHHVGSGTDLEWLDGVCFCCGTERNFWQGKSGDGGRCRNCSATWDGAPSFKREPEAGTWKLVSLPPRQEKGD